VSCDVNDLALRASGLRRNAAPPDGSLICTDCYGGEYRDSLVLIDVATGEVEKLCNVPTVHGRSHETGTHPHPCWAPDGKSLIYDSDETGHCQLYQVFVED